MHMSGSAAKVVISTLNAKYIHTSLALRYLQGYCRTLPGYAIEIQEFTINQTSREIMAELFLAQPKVLGFSCYIWNITEILGICDDFKLISPDTIIVLGGPEASYSTRDILTKHPGVDCIVRGEGEQTLADLLQAIASGTPWSHIAGLSYRQAGAIIANSERDLLAELDRIPSPYCEEAVPLADKIIYYESSRGCPFRCAYCLSAATPGVRYFSLDRVKRDLDYLLDLQPREIKFVDRTFNIDEGRFRAITEFIVARRGRTKVHFEIDAGLFSDQMLAYLESLPPDLFNFEIGVQSTYSPALEAVGRKMDWARLSRNVSRLRSAGNIHLHLDLIAGLPGEDYDHFARSFDMVYQLRPDYLQMGFLKLLQGSPLWGDRGLYGYICQQRPPYQIMANSCIFYEQIIKLEYIEDLVSRYYNSGDMPKALAYLVEMVYDSRAMAFYSDLADYWLSRKLFGLGHRKAALYQYLLGFVSGSHHQYLETLQDLLKYDYLCFNHTYGLPAGFTSYNPEDIHERIYAKARDQDFMDHNLPSLALLSPRDRKKLLHIEYFCFDPLGQHCLDEPVPFLFAYDPIRKTADRVIRLEDRPAT